ncbi:MAG: hydantoinase B/oxoprolinase family protein [Geminicoccaceae bacterium]
MDHTVPANAGSFRCLDIKIRENCCVGIPRHPHSCSVATTNLADRVTNPVQRAIADIARGFGMAETGPIMPPGIAVISGRDPRHDGAPFVNQLHLAISGGAGTPASDGFLSIIHAGNAGLSRIDCVEVDELHHPIIVTTRRLVPDTEGAGEHRGALAIHGEYGPIEGCNLRVLYTMDGSINAAAGAVGGLSGAPSRAFRRNRDGSLTELPACHGLTLAPGERVVSHSAAGGGYGSPLDRDPELVLRDVAEGWVSAERASTVYGVVLTGEASADRLAIDLAATDQRRADLRTGS